MDVSLGPVRSDLVQQMFSQRICTPPSGRGGTGSSQRPQLALWERSSFDQGPWWGPQGQLIPSRSSHGESASLPKVGEVLGAVSRTGGTRPVTSRYGLG